MLRLRISAAAESAVRGGHPWVFADSVREANRTGTTGELAVIYDRRDRFLAIGLYDAESPLRLRVLQAGRPVRVDAAWWRMRLEASMARRHGIAGENTSGLRCINGESDGWPGLVLDRYEDVAVLKLYTAAWLPWLGDVQRWIDEALRPSAIVLRMSRNMQHMASTRFQLNDGQILSGVPVQRPVVFRENGVRFEADVVRGQKTGFFLDQRENRRLIRGMAPGREVLNAFSFSGGFSMYALHGGAASVTDIDISEHALAAARRNLELNGQALNQSSLRYRGIQADVFEWLAGNTSEKFDLIILDPPSLAKREAERAGAIRAYASLAQNALGHLKTGGILAAFSCSAHVTADEFFGAVRHAASASGRRWSETATAGHAADHPATFREAVYLKGIYLQF